MKANLSRMLRSGVAMLLAFCMVAGFIPTAAFATEADEINYVSLGDSMTNGLGLGTGYDSTGHQGYQEIDTSAYPALVAKEFGWNLTQLATSAMRLEDLHFILEYGDPSVADPYQGDAWTYNDVLINGRWGTDAASVANVYQTAVREADVISMAAGNGNLGVYMMDMIMTLFGMGYGSHTYEDCTLEKALNEHKVDAETKAIAMQVYNAAKAYLGERMPSELVSTIADRMAYVTVNFVMHYEGAMSRMLELNDDADYIIVELMNTMSGYEIDFTFDGETTRVDFEALLNLALDPLNAYLAGLPAVWEQTGKYPEADFFYVEVGSLETHSKTFKETYKEPVTRDRFVTDIVGGGSGMLWSLASGAVPAGVTLTAPSVGDITAYEEAINTVEDETLRKQLFAGYAANNMDKLTGIVLYLALENALLTAMDSVPNVALDEIEVPDGSYDLMGIVGANMGALSLPTPDAATVAAFLDIVAASAAQAAAGAAWNSMDQTQRLTAINAAKANADVQANAGLLATAYITPTALADALTANSFVTAMLSLYARLKMANGMSAHPNANDHKMITANIIAAYGEYTVGDETIENIEILLNELYNLVETYGPEVAAQVWQQWEEYGYVDAVETSIDELKTMLEDRYAYYTETALPAINDSVSALAAQKDALTVELGKLNTELAAKKAELAEVINNTEISDIYVPNINIDVELGNNTQTIVPGNDCAVDGEDIEAKLEAAIKDIEHAITTIEALIADIEADIADMVALAEQITAAVAELEKTMADVAAAVEDLEKAINDVINIVKNSDGVVAQVVNSFNAARAAAEAAVETMTLAMDTAEDIMADVDTMIQKITADAEALYNKFMNDLPGCIDQIPEEAKMLIAGSVYAVQQAYEANKADIEAALTAELTKLAEEYGINEETVKAELDKLTKEYETNKAAVETELATIEAKIAEEVNAKYAEVKADFDAQIEAKKAEAAVKLAELEAELKGYEAELAGLAADAAQDVIDGIQAQINRVKADMETVNADLACAIEHLENAAQEAYEQIVAEVTKVYEETVAALNQKLVELKAVYDEAVAAIEQKLAELKAAYEKAIEDLTAAADKAIAELTGELNKALEELNKALADQVNGILSAIREELLATQQAIEEILKGNLAAIEELKNTLIEMGGEAIADAVDALVDAVNALIEEATTADLVIDDDFKYIAIGDGSAAPESYVEKLAAALNAEAAENGVNEIEMVNYAKAGNTVTAERANLSDVTGADLITIGFSNVEFLSKAVANAGNGEKMDWAAVVGEENVQYVDQLLAEVAAKITETGIEGESAAMVNAAIEAYAYAAVLYATELPELVNDIHAVNPDALVIIVGMYNPMAGVTISLTENATLDISEYVDYLVEGVGVHGVAYSILTGNSIYVDAPAVQTLNTDTELGVMDLLKLIVTDYAALYPSGAGDDYIAAQIAAALDITYAKPVENIEVKHNVTLESYIDFSFFIPKSALAASGLTATIFHDRADGYADKIVTLAQDEWESTTVDGVDYWRIRYTDVAAKEMTDDLTLTIADASGTVVTDTYSVAAYAKERIENSTNNDMKSLMNAMLHYGAAAQIYFNYQTNKLANAGLSAPTFAGIAAAANSSTTVKHNLTLESDINFSFFIPKSALAESGLTATVCHDRADGYADKSVTLAQAEWESAVVGGVEYWRIRYSDVAAKEIADTLSLTITDGTDAVVTDIYCVEHYAQERIQNTSDNNMKTLMQTLLDYGAAAQVYFGY